MINYSVSFGYAVIRSLASLSFVVRGRSQTTEDRCFKVLHTRPPRLSEQTPNGGKVEQQNKEPQNDEVITSIFEIPSSPFCGSQSMLPQIRIPRFEIRNRLSSVLRPPTSARCLLSAAS